MAGKRLLLLALVACGLAQSCAQPKYENASAAGGETARQTQGQGAGVSFPKAGLQLMWRWETDPAGTAEGTLLLRTYRTSAVDGMPEPADVPGSLTMKLWMPDMGHGSSPTTVERPRDAGGQPVPGAYRIKDIYFIMPGVWEMIFEIQDGGEVRDSAKLTLVRAS